MAQAMNTEVRLLPCPFCGGAAEVYPEEESFTGSGYYVSCFQPAFPVTECYCAVGENYDRDAMPEHVFPTKEAAIAAWNTRNDPLRRAAEAVLRVVANKNVSARMKVIAELRAALAPE